MIGLEHILNLCNLTQQELADELGIAKQNINRWIRGERNIPEKYLDIIKNRFNMPIEYFSKELNSIDIEKINIIFKQNKSIEISEEDYKKLLVEEILFSVKNMINEYDCNTLKGLNLIITSLDKNKLNDSLSSLFNVINR